MIPKTRYAKTSDGFSIAYQILGDGGLDLVYLPGFVSNLEYQWENPLYARFLRRLASFSRLIMIDRRGTGLSDRVSPKETPPIEVLMDDLGAVLDEAGSRRAALTGFADGADLCALFAATHPDRTAALVLYGASAITRHADDTPWGWTEEEWESYLEDLAIGWGTEEYVQQTLRWAAPSVAADEGLQRWFGSFLRMAASPAAAVAIETICRDIDLRPILPTITVPTLVVHRIEDAVESIEGARYIAERIPHAKLVELPGGDQLPWAGDADALTNEIEEFLTGARRAPEFDRILTTVLFTDIVDSTQRTASLGDARWSDLLRAHYELVRAEVTRYRGKEIDTAGDGFLATFDGPARAVRCAQAIGEAVRALDIHIRAGVHTGEVELDNGKVRGIAVHVGARIAAMATADEVLVSSTVRDLVGGSGLNFDDHGLHALKGVPGAWHLYVVAQG